MQTDTPVSRVTSMFPGCSPILLHSASGEVFVLLLLGTDRESAESPALDDVTTAVTL